MYHSITIGEKNTFDDWHLIFPGRPTVVMPQPKLNYVDVLGKSGSIDYTNALVKTPRYSDREGTWEFILLNPGDIESITGRDDHTAYDIIKMCFDISSYCDGRFFDRIVLEDDPDYAYSGRVWVSDVQSGSGWTRIIFSYHLGPFKHRLYNHVVQKFADLDSEDPIESSTTYSADIVVPPGSQFSPLFIKFHLAETTAKARTRYIKYHLSNEDNGGDETRVFIGSNFDKVHEFSGVGVSNYSGNSKSHITLSYLNQESIEPIIVEYWWNEAIL